MSTYRKPKHAPQPGELRMKSWQTLPGMDIAPDDALWSERCRQYWELQARLYGWRMSAYSFSYVTAYEGARLVGFVSTYCAVMEILPGYRTDDYSLVPVESAQVGSMAN